MSTLDKYKKITKESTKSAENEILVSNKGDPMRHITYGTALLKEGGKKTLTVKASGAAMARAVKVGLYLRKRIPGIALLTKITNREVIDEYEPLEEGLDKVIVNRKMVVLEIVCSCETLDKKDPGYKAPITEEEIEAEKAYIEKRRKESTGSQNKRKGSGKPKGNQGGKPKGGNQGGAKPKGNQEEVKTNKPAGGNNKKKGGPKEGAPAKEENKPKGEGKPKKPRVKKEKPAAE